MPQLYSEFKLVFEKDPKVNITSIDHKGYVLGHLAILANNPESIMAGLEKLRTKIQDLGLGEKVLKYEVVFPTNTDEDDYFSLV